jgi:hypothetical protein
MKTTLKSDLTTTDELIGPAFQPPKRFTACTLSWNAGTRSRGASPCGDGQSWKGRQSKQMHDSFL